MHFSRIRVLGQNFLQLFRRRGIYARYRDIFTCDTKKQYCGTIEITAALCYNRCVSERARTDFYKNMEYNMINHETIISFPGLGIGEFSVNSVAFSVFDISIAWYGIIIVLGMIAAFCLCIMESKEKRRYLL